MRPAIISAIAVLFGACASLSAAEEARSLEVSGDYAWGGKRGTITGTLAETDTPGTYDVTFEPIRRGRAKSGYAGTMTIAEDGTVSGEIDHRKEGRYTLSGRRQGNRIVCQYDGKKSRKDNPLSLTIQTSEDDSRG